MIRAAFQFFILGMNGFYLGTKHFSIKLIFIYGILANAICFILRMIFIFLTKFKGFFYYKNGILTKIRYFLSLSRKIRYRMFYYKDNIFDDDKRLFLSFRTFRRTLIYCKIPFL